MAETVSVVGDVSYREGDGPMMPIRPGPCEIQETELDVTISWEDGDNHLAAVLPVADFRRFVKTGAIRRDSAPAAAQGATPAASA
jgi:hypothetical protein